MALSAQEKRQVQLTVYGVIIASIALGLVAAVIRSGRK